MHMRNQALIVAIALSLLSISVIAYPPFSKLALGNPIVYHPPTATIWSPRQSETFSTQNIPLNVTVRLYGYTYNSIEQVKNLNYSIDGRESSELTLIYPTEYAPGYDVTAIVILTNLSNGSHTVTVLGETTFGKSLNATATFEINLQPNGSSEDIWSKMSSMPTARAGLGVAVVNEKIFAIGGRNQSSTLASNEMYDPFTNNWTVLAPMPTPMSYFGIGVCQSKIYCIGGSNGSNQVYDPQTNTWTTKASMPTSRSQLQANVVNGKIFLVGGLLPNSVAAPNITNANEAYDPTTNTWSEMAPIPTAVFNYASAVVDNKIYVISGYYAKEPTNLTQVYDPKTNIWTLTAPLPAAVSGGAAGATTGAKAPKQIFLVGGISQTTNGSLPTQVFDIEKGSWTFAVGMERTRVYLAVGILDDVLYALGGLSSIISPSTVYNLNEAYIPIGYGKVSLPSPSPSLLHLTSQSPSPTLSPATTATLSPSPSIPEFPTWLLIPSILASALLTIYWRRWSKK